MDPSTERRLTPENYGKGFLIDEELLAGVTEEPIPSEAPGNSLESPKKFIAFVLRHSTGEYLGYRPFEQLDEALKAINAIPRDWTYESTSGCGSGKCGTTAGCGKKGFCPKVC